MRETAGKACGHWLTPSQGEGHEVRKVQVGNSKKNSGGESHKIKKKKKNKPMDRYQIHEA